MPNALVVVCVPLLTSAVVGAVGGVGALLVFAIITVTVLGFALPLLRRREAWRYDREVTHRSELVADRDAVLRAIKDLEGEFESGKLGATDYERLRAELKAEAVKLTLEVRQEERTLRDAREAIAVELAQEASK